jgi:hypothetical protein
MSEVKRVSPRGAALLGLLAALLVSVALAPGASAAPKYTFCYNYQFAGGPFTNGACKAKGSPNGYAAATPAKEGTSQALAFCEEKSGGAYKNAYCTEKGSGGSWEQTTIPITPPQLEGTTGSTTLIVHFGVTPLEITCSSGTYQQQPYREGETSGTLELKSCTVAKPAGCEVSNSGGRGGTLNFDTLDGHVEESAGQPVEKFAGATEYAGSKILVELELKGSACGSYNGKVLEITGSQKCEFDAKAPVLLAEHQLICKASGSELKWGTENVTYEATTTIKAEGGYKWSPDAATLPAEQEKTTSKHKIDYCQNVGLEEGQYNNGKCSEAGGKKEFVIVTPSLWSCLKVTSGSGSFKNSACTEAGGADDWELEWGTGPYKLEGQLGTTVLKGHAATITTQITCKGSFEAQPAAEGETSQGKIEYSSCTVNKPSGCVIKEPIVASYNGLLEESGGKLEDKLTGSGASEKLGEIAYGEGCGSLKGKEFALSGAQVCPFASGIGTFEEKHELVCETSGSKLKIGTESATYEGKVTITAPSDEAWSAS